MKIHPPASRIRGQALFVHLRSMGVLNNTQCPLLVKSLRSGGSFHSIHSGFCPGATNTSSEPVLAVHSDFATTLSHPATATVGRPASITGLYSSWRVLSIGNPSLPYLLLKFEKMKPISNIFHQCSPQYSPGVISIHSAVSGS